MNKELSKSKKRKEDKSEMRRKASPDKDLLKKSAEAENLLLAQRLQNKELKRQ